MTKLKVSLIIPAYNEEKTIENIIQQSKKYVYETIVVVAKLSKDDTFLIASKIADKCVIDDGQGKGAALKLGVENAEGDIILFMDADGSHNPKDIPKIIWPIIKENYDLVVGSRALGGSDELHGTLREFMRNVGGALVMLCINYFFSVKFTDCENGFRAIKKDIFKSLILKSTDFEIEQEMFIKMLRKGHRILEVPSHEYKRKFGESNLDPLKIGWKFAWRFVISLFDKISVIKREYDFNYFENIAYKEKGNSLRNKKRLNEILNSKHSGKLLEIGCGMGEFLKIAKEYFDVGGIDVSEYAVNKASHLFGKNIQLSNIENASLAENKYDIIVVFNILEHLNNPEEVIKKLYFALKQNGLLIGSVPNNFGIIGKLFTSITNILDRTHCSTLSTTKWISMLNSAGFNSNKFFGEWVITRNHTIYIKTKFWKHFSHNFIFLCYKK